MAEPKKPRVSSTKPSSTKPPRRTSKAGETGVYDEFFGPLIETAPVDGPFAVDGSEEVSSTKGSSTNAVQTPSDIEVIWADASRLLDNPFQPRSRVAISRLQGLKRSMNEQGQLQAALGRRVGRVIQLAVGHRRRDTVLTGANAGSHMPDPDQYAGKLLVEIRALGDQQMLDAGWDENDEREDVSIFDHANRYVKMRELAPGPSTGVSWEDLVVIRERMGKPLKLKARSIRRIVEILRLPSDVQDRLGDINLAARSETGEEEEKFIGVSEKHCRALLLLQPKEETVARATSQQIELLGQIETELLSANETLRRAEAMRDGENLEPSKTKKSRKSNGNSGGNESETSSRTSSSSTSDSSSTNPTGTLASQGVGMVVAAGSVSAPKTETDTERQDIATQLLKPATDLVASAAKLLPELRLSGAAREEYFVRVDAAAQQLESQIDELRLALPENLLPAEEVVSLGVDCLMEAANALKLAKRYIDQNGARADQARVLIHFIRASISEIETVISARTSIGEVEEHGEGGES